MRKFYVVLCVILVSVFWSVALTACKNTKSSDDIFNGVFVFSDCKSEAEQPTNWLAVIDDKVTLKQGDKIQTFTVYKDAKAYSADSYDKKISFTLTGEKLVLKIAQEQNVYVLDKEYKYSKTSQPLSIPVLDFQINNDSRVQYVKFSGATREGDLRVQIKKAGEESYSEYAVECGEIRVAATALKCGDNFVKIHHAGGYPNIDKNKKFFMQSDSEIIEYKITVDGSGNISGVQNEIVLANGVYQFAYADGFLTQEEQERCNFIVLNNVLRSTYMGGNSLYYLSEQDGVYSAHLGSAEGTVGITFTVKNDVLSAKIFGSGREYQLKKNNKYTYSDTTEKLEKPSSFEGEIADEGRIVYFSIGASEYSFPIGAKVEIKKAGDSSYVFDSIAKNYINFIHTDNLFADEFAVGENYIRISNAGGPDFNNQNIYYLLQDSDYIEYKITLDENGILSSLIRLS